MRQMDRPRFPRNLGKLMGNLSFFRRGRISYSNRGYECHIFFSILRILLRGRFYPTFGQLLAVTSYRKGSFLETNGLAMIPPGILVGYREICHLARPYIEL